MSPDTISRWIKKVLSNSGIDSNVFSAHSTRGAASSSAFGSVDLDSILSNADWSSGRTFKKFYHSEALHLFSQIL